MSGKVDVAPPESSVTVAPPESHEGVTPPDSPVGVASPEPTPEESAMIQKILAEKKASEDMLSSSSMPASRYAIFTLVALALSIIAPFISHVVTMRMVVVLFWSLSSGVTAITLLKWWNARKRRLLRALQDKKSGGVPRIRGLGSAIPTVDGTPGIKIPTRVICQCLREEYGIHNPKSEKPLTDDWAERHLCMRSVAFGNAQEARKVAPPSAHESFPKDAEGISEQGLMFQAFDQALRNSRIAVQDIDVLIHASCTTEDIHFYEGMRSWYEQYPALSKKLIPIQLPLGCPVLIQALKLGQNLLASQDITNVAIVTSNSVSDHYQMKNVKAYVKDNEIVRWLNTLVFGDAAFSCILSTSTENLPERTYRLVDAEIRCDPEVFIASRRTEVVPGYDEPAEYFVLNPFGPKEIPSSLREWLGWLYKKYGYSMGSFEHVVFHQANPKVIRMVCERFQCAHKTAVVGEEYGNQGCCSIGCSLHQRLEKSENKPKHGDKVLGYALGALLGNSHGVFLLECEVRDGGDGTIDSD